MHNTIFQTLYHTQGIAESHILYTLRTRSGDSSAQWLSNVWQADYDGGNAKQLTHDDCLCVTPAFVPSQEGGRCRNFLYVSYKIGQPKIFASTLESSAGKRLMFLRGNQLMPAIAPTLDKIAFISDITGNPDLFVQDFSLEEGVLGKPRQVFCAPGATQGTPTFSPDGKKLAFVSNKDGTPRIYILDIPPPGASIKDLKPKMISKKTRENTSPPGRPMGKKSPIVLAHLERGKYGFMTPSQAKRRSLTDGHGHKENPTWAPNSLHLMFNSSTTTTSDLFMINLNQKKAVKITTGPGKNGSLHGNSTKIKEKYEKSFVPGALALAACTNLTSCCRSRCEVWEDTKTCSRYLGKGVRSLFGQHVDSGRFCQLLSKLGR